MAFDQNVYFGIPGSLVTLPHPRGDVGTTRVRARQAFPLGNGEMRTRGSVHGSRTFELSYESIDYATHATLLAFDQGHYGPGPFALLDPGQRNQLTVNQSSATSLTNDATNFSIAGSAQTIGSSSTLATGTPRSLSWTFNASSPASGASVLTLDPPYAGWPGIPVVPARSMCFSCQIRGGGSDAIATLRAALDWYDISSALLSTSTGTPVATASGAWAQLSVAAVPPANSVFVRPKVQYVTGASFGTILYLTQFQLEEATTPGTWRPGTGVRPVMVAGYADTWPWLYPTEVRRGATLLLREDGR